MRVVSKIEITENLTFRNSAANRHAYSVSVTTLLGIGRRLILTLLLSCGYALPAAAHGPIFITHIETPGKHALDLDTHIRSAPGGEVHIEPFLLLGLSRTLAFSFGPSFHRADGAGDFRSRSLGGGVKWRFWNRDSFGMKQAMAMDLGLQVNSHRQVDKGLMLNRNYHAVLGYGIEQIHFNFVTGVQFAHSSEPDVRHGSSHNQYVVDLGAGYRFYPVENRPFDVTLFLGLSRRLAPDTAQYIAPELWISPFPRLLMKVGYRIRLTHGHGASSSAAGGSGTSGGGPSHVPSDVGHTESTVEGREEPEGVFGYGIEFRF